MPCFFMIRYLQNRMYLNLQEGRCTMVEWWEEIVGHWGQKSVEFLLFLYGLGVYHLPGSGRDFF